MEARRIMHPKWIAVFVFWAALILAVALPSPKAGDLVWVSIGLLAILWTTLVIVVRAVRNRGDPGALEKAFFSGRGYPRWFLRFVLDDYEYGRSKPAAKREAEYDRQ
jgi:hypothetical protein